MEDSIFYQLSLVLVLATVVSVILKALRQPLILGYILTGFLAGPSMLNLIHDHDAFASFSQIGIALLLFIVGLGLNAAVIRSAGKPVFLTFLAMVPFVGGLGFLAAQLLGMTDAEALIVGIGLLCSSTIIVVKSLSDRKEQSRLYGRIAVGILLVDDILATFALLFVSSAAGPSGTVPDTAVLLAKGVALGSGLALTSAFVLPRLVRVAAKIPELLYVGALAWGFGVASLFWWAGFSVEVGALFAGVALAHLPYAQSIGTKLTPLRDFFIVLFFVGLGQELAFDNLTAAFVPALIFSAIVMVSKPLVVLSSLGVLGYTKQTSFKTAVHVSQISEFSIILVVLAASTGLVSPELTATVTLTAIITIALSTYLMHFSDRLYRWLQRPLAIFERSEVKRELLELQHYPLVLFGYREGGREFVRTFRRMKKPYVVVDFNPDVIETLQSQHINHIYGDVTDFELLDEIGVHRSELIVSSLNDTDTNRLLLGHIMRRNQQAIFICHANSYDDAEMLYKLGAAYVILPHFIGTEQINDFIRKNGSNKKAFQRYRRHHLIRLGNLAIV